ncbi:flocculation protein FLO11-like [Coregonus clupeaformis]|uniref:flocculation protein FLO11-like n=1 Tax=Coregonus clupeaformis TaxID=59861 RepID=UPI001E1C6FD6|nr:flocculation protein FLO11-like [Coregonus clupeaformis]
MSSEEVNAHDGPTESTSSSLSAEGSPSGTSDLDQPKQTGPPTRRARLPKPKPNLGHTARAATRSAVQVPESRPSSEVQTPEEAEEVPMEIQQIHQVIPLSNIIDTTQDEIQQIHQVTPHPPIEGPLRQREGNDIGHASQVESGFEVSEGSEQQTTSQTRRSHFPKVKPKPNLGRAARTTQPKPQQTTTTLSEPPQNTTTLSEPPQPTENITTLPKPTQTTTTLSEPPQTTTTLSEPPLQPMLNITTTSEPQPTPSLEQPGPGTLRPRAPVPESPLRLSEEVKGDDDHKENTSSYLSAGGSQSGTSDSDQPKQTDPPTRMARLPKPKPNSGRIARAATHSAIQVPESRPSPEVQTPNVVASRPKSEVQSLETGLCPEVQTPEEADEVPIEIQQIHQVIPLSDIVDTTQEEIQQIHQVIPHPPIEGRLRQREGTDIGHASQVESGFEVSEGSEQQTTSQTRRRHFPKVKPKPNLGRAARTTQPKPQQTTTTLSEPPQNTTTLSEPPQPTENITTQPKPQQTTTTLSEPPPPQPILNITTTSEPQLTMNITTEPPLPTESITTESETQPKQRTTAHSKSQPTTTHSKPTTNIIPHSEPQPIQKTRVAYSKPQPTLNTTTHSEPPQPTLNSITNTLSKPQSTQITTILSQPQPTPSLEQPGPGTLRPRAPVPESPLMSSEEVKAHDGPTENTSSSLSAGGSQSGTPDSDQPKQTGPPTRRARLPKPKPNLGRTARASTRYAVQVPESRPSPEVQTPNVVASRPKSEVQRLDTDEVPMEEIQQIHQVIPLTDIIDTTQGDTALFTEGNFFSQQSDAVITQHSESSVSTALLDQAQSDPDEPIFILSLTEIPVLPTGEEYGCTSQTVSDPFSFLPVADACAHLQQSDIVAPGGGLEKGNAGILWKVPEPMSVDEVLPQPSYTSIKEVESGSTAGPVGLCASGKPSEDPMADAETSEDTDPPSKKRKVPERARRDKLQVRPNTAVRKQPSCSAPAKEAVSAITPDQTTSLTTTTPDTDHPTASKPPAQPGLFVTGTASREVVAGEPQQWIVGCLDLPETEATPTGGEDSSSGVESQDARQITPLAMSGPLSRPGRRPRGFLSFMSNKTTSPAAAPPRGSRAAALRPQVNTTRPGGKRAAPAPSTTTRTMPAPSTTQNTTTPTRATRTTTKPDFSPRVTREKPSDVQALHSDPKPSTSLCTTATESSQVPAAQPSVSPCVDSGSADEEPINVSQYFFSDIFTEVEENEG